MVLAFLHCESHPGRLLIDHLLDVRNRLGLDDAHWLACAGLFHDVGKATSFFNEYLHGKKIPPELSRHAEIGAFWLMEVIKPIVASGRGMTPVEAALAILFVRRHHGSLDDLFDGITLPDQRTLDRLHKQLGSMDVEGIAGWLVKRLGGSISRPVLDSHSLTELRVKTKNALRQPCPDVEAMVRFQTAIRDFGRLIEADRDSAAKYAAGSFDAPPQLSLEHLAAFRCRGNFGATTEPVVAAARNRVYTSAVAHVHDRPANLGHLWTLTVPTGAGKTLAALGWALARRQARAKKGLRSCPIIYALPFTSIIDQNVAVILKLWGDGTVDESSLAVHHHLAEPGQIERGGEASLARSWVEGWRADIICTTFVQIVGAMFHATSANARRFNKLAGSILILDEVQAFPAELWPVLRVALQSLSQRFQTDILLVTATQPALFSQLEREEIGVESPEFVTVFDRYDVYVDATIPLTVEDLARQIATELCKNDNGSCLIILNTVREALELYASLAKAPNLREYRLFHLSTNLRPKDRTEILKQLNTCRQPHILVATQVVEAGVDLSFDVVFRALAPLDAIVQAAGRCNRHGNGRRGIVHVFDLEGNSGVIVYGRVHICLAREVFQDRTSFREPDLRNLVNQYFERLENRLGHDAAKKILEAVRMMQFAALRGEGEDKDRDAKAVQLIYDAPNRIAHFVETDESDERVWKQQTAALQLPDLIARRKRLRTLRNELAQRVVEIPRQHTYQTEPDDRSGYVYVPQSVSSDYYDTTTGWKRNR
ncbi:MAG: CRISPR-associated helicase Cas3' [Acidobacteriia bacterium]|nr:CRISPR-associated helicase Cas3' [Terriglobia bacterium]